LNKKEPIRKNNRSKSKKIGWLCTYVPEEIIIACGFTPFRITGDKKAKKSEGYFPINFCPYVKSSMEEIMEIKDDLEGVVFTNSCDAMKRFYDLTKEYIPELPAFMLDVPRNKNELALKHFTGNLSGMIKSLESVQNKKSNDKNLIKAIEICNEKRALLKKLQELFKTSPDVVKTSIYFNLVMSSMIEEPQAFIDELKEFINTSKNSIKSDHINDRKSDKNPEEISRVMIVGNFINEENLWNIFDELDCRVAAEDLCSASRYFEDIYGSEELTETINSPYYKEIKKLPENSIDRLLTDISLRYLFKPQCMRMSNLGVKVDEIKTRIKKNKVQGLIFISQKFCDNTLLFYPLLRQYLNDIKVPSLFLEIEHNNLSSGQIKTRIQAFIEII
jgi:benzoyl-CoA reductase/2-hydroxyglutaryl-CoA dehydratase subunit BcrC/BadD/HgdB